MPTSSIVKAMQFCLPVLEWHRELSLHTLRVDIVAGIIAGVMLIPTALSWAQLAQIPLGTGFSASLVGSFAYGTFGQCGSLSIGPVAEITTLLISISSIPIADRENAFQAIGVQVGILSMALSAIGGGEVIRTMFAKAVGDGYTCAAAILVVVFQIKTMFNVPAPSSSVLQDAVRLTAIALVDHLTWKSLLAFFFFSIYAGYLLLMKRVKTPSWVPHQVIVVIVATLLTRALNLNEFLHLGIVGSLPSTLPPPALPSFNNAVALAPYTLTVTVLAFLQSYVIARKVAPSIDPDRELFASGACNFLCCITGGMPVSSSLSRSAVLISQGARTPITAYVAGVVMMVTIFVLARLEAFYYLPNHALTAIIVAGVIKLIDFTEAQHLYRVSKMDFAVWCTSFTLTLIGGLTVGVLSGIALSLVLVILRVARPRTAALGFLPETQNYEDLRQDPELLTYPRILVWRFDAPLYFVNTGFFEQALRAAIQNEVRPIDVIVVNCAKMNDIDAAALSNLPLLLRTIEKMDPQHPRRVLLAQLHGRVEAVLRYSALAVRQRREIDDIDELNELLDVFASAGPAGAEAAAPDGSGSTCDAACAAKATSNVASGGGGGDQHHRVIFRTVAEAVTFAQRLVASSHCLAEARRVPRALVEPRPAAAFVTDALIDAHAMGGELAEVLRAAGHDAPAAAVAMADDPACRDSPIAAAAAVDVADGGSTAAETAAATAQSKLRHRFATASLFSDGSRELVGVIAVVRHSERTPKQKIKVPFSHPPLLALSFPAPSGTPLSSTAGKSSSKKDAAFVARFAATTRAAAEAKEMPAAEAAALLNALRIAEAAPRGCKVQFKELRSSSDDDVDAAADGFAVTPGVKNSSKLTGSFAAGGGGGLLIVKWGGALTDSGVAQAHVLGKKLLARCFAAGDVPLRKLPMFRERVTSVAGDEDRLLETALIVTRALTGHRELTLKGAIIIGGGDGGDGAAVAAPRTLAIERDNALLVDLPAAARAAIRREYAELAAVLHTRSAAAARYHMHVPGMRRLVAIPYVPVAGYAQMRDADTTTTSTAAAAAAAAASEAQQQQSGRVSPARTEPSTPAASPQPRRTPHDALRFVATQLRRIAAADLSDLPPWTALHEHEDAPGLQLRWRAIAAEFLRDPGLCCGADGARAPNNAPAAAAAATCTVGDSASGGARRRAPTATPLGVSPSQTWPAPASSAHPEYDLSNVQKMAEYAVYDAQHNAPLLQALPSAGARSVGAALLAMREVIEVVQMVAASMLSGSSSSSRLIIGSLTCAPLMQRIAVAVSAIIAADRDDGARELLARARTLYRAAHAGLADNARLAIVRGRLAITAATDTVVARAAPLRSSAAAAATAAAATNATTSPLDDAAAEEAVEGAHAPLPPGEHFIDPFRSFDAEAARDDAWATARTQLFFAPHSHVSGLIACLFESHSVRGFRPPPQVAEGLNSALHFMTHVVFKVFRTRAPAAPSDSAFDEQLLQLPLTIKSRAEDDRDAGAEARLALRRELLAAFDRRYATTVEVFLSTGTEAQRDDSGGVAEAAMATAPMLRVHAGLTPQQLRQLVNEVQDTASSQLAQGGARPD